MLKSRRLLVSQVLLILQKRIVRAFEGLRLCLLFLIIWLFEFLVDGLHHVEPIYCHICVWQQCRADCIIMVSTYRWPLPQLGRVLLATVVRVNL